jgi:diguanylate cyclase (GGDEF)-like protein
LDELANKDPLTDLHNRRTIVERIDDQENRSHDDGKQFSIIMADIDHFKNFLMTGMVISSETSI